MNGQFLEDVAMTREMEYHHPNSKGGRYLAGILVNHLLNTRGNLKLSNWIVLDLHRPTLT
jgi:hypothetical protein